MKPFRFVRTTTADEAVRSVLSDDSGAFLAGGTTLVDLMKENVMSPRLLTDINGLPLAQIEAKGGGVRVGALVRNSDMAEHPLIRERYPMLSQALLSGASQQLRNAATLGGNLLQRTRCYYFRDPGMPCNKREPGSGCGALDGYNRIHAVLGGSDKCIATHPSDMCVALAALDAVIQVHGPKGDRAIPFQEFYLLPGNTPERENTLERGELIVGVDLPDAPYAKTSHYLKVRDRESYEFALASAAVALNVADGVIKEARIALGGVGTVPWRAKLAEGALIGAKPDEAAFRKAAEAELQVAQPHQFNAFKIELCKRTIVRALSEVGRPA